MDFTALNRLHLAAAAFAALTVFFGLVAFLTGVDRGAKTATAYAATPSQVETFAPQPQGAQAPIAAGNSIYGSACAEGGNLMVRLDPHGDAYCHRFFAAPSPNAAVGPRRPVAVAPRAKPARALSTAMTSAIAAEAHNNGPSAERPLSLALAPNSESGEAWSAPYTPGGGLPGALAFGALFGGGGDQPGGGGGPGNPAPLLPDPEDPPLPLEPGGPDDPMEPFDPTDPTDPIDPGAPTVVPIPGALFLWGPGLAALILASRRKSGLIRKT